MNYQIKITGSGTKIEILSALEALISTIYRDVKNGEEYSASWEDETLCTDFFTEDEQKDTFPENTISDMVDIDSLDSVYNENGKQTYKAGN